MTREIEVRLPVEDQFLADILSTAVEGGINYWAQVVVYKWTEGPEHTKAEILEVDSSNAHFTIGLDVIAEGIQRVLGNDHSVSKETVGYVLAGVREQDAGEIDSIAADVIVQFGLFDELRYA